MHWIFATWICEWLWRTWHDLISLVKRWVLSPFLLLALVFPGLKSIEMESYDFFFLLPLVVYAQASVCKKNPHGSLCGELVGLLIFILSCARTMLVEWNIPARSGKEKIYACMSSSKTCKHGGQWASSVSKFSCVFGQCVSLLPGIITKLQTD